MQYWELVVPEEVCDVVSCSHGAHGGNDAGVVMVQDTMSGPRTRTPDYPSICTPEVRTNLAKFLEKLDLNADKFAHIW